MSRDIKPSKLAKDRMKSATKTTGNSTSLDTSDEMKLNDIKPADMLPTSAKLAIGYSAIKGSSLKREANKIQKLESEYRRWDQKYQMLKMPNQSKNGPSGGDVFADTFHKIMMQLKMDDLEKRKKRNEKATQRHQKLWRGVTGAVQGVGRLADTTTRKSAYSQMTGKTSDLDIPSYAAQDMAVDYNPAP